ncbi:SMP-30/gluconolactonase/LRE family protein [Amycolatopsis silviterrae]|uniref:SMP-30/gluconolactonase/LRE family protein n=1 Tax=Amycolatopsis silviterrae TaxID=1656914 RepID=A0ABW5HLV7_9PSEU
MSARATRLRALVTLTVTAAALATLALPASAARTTAAGQCPSRPDSTPAAATAGAATTQARTITIDDKCAYPESVAVDHEYIYTGNISTGTIYRGKIGARTLEPFLPGGQDGRGKATGIKTTGNRLLVAGAFDGNFFVYTKAGKLVSAYRVPNAGEQTLVNDAAVAPNGDVYVTDSFRAVVYRIPAAEVHAPATGAHRTLQAAYRLPDYVADQSNGNGIVAGPDGGSLIIGYWYSGALYRLDLATGGIRKIDAPPLHGADGIARRGNTLYIARSEDNTIVTARLSGDGASATVVSERTYPGADTTTGVAVLGNRLLVTNSQMDTYLYQKPLTSPVFTLASLPLH